MASLISLSLRLRSCWRPQRSSRLSIKVILYLQTEWKIGMIMIIIIGKNCVTFVSINVILRLFSPHSWTACLSPATEAPRLLRVKRYMKCFMGCFTDKSSHNSMLYCKLHNKKINDNLFVWLTTIGIAIQAFGPIGSPGRWAAAVDPNDPILLEDPLINEIAKKHQATAAQASRLNRLQEFMFLSYPVISVNSLDMSSF